MPASPRAAPPCGRRDPMDPPPPAPGPAPRSRATGKGREEDIASWPPRIAGARCADQRFHLTQPGPPGPPPFVAELQPGLRLAAGKALLDLHIAGLLELP